MGWNRGGVGESIKAINPTGLIPFGDEKALIERIPVLIKKIALNQYLENLLRSIKRVKQSLYMREHLKLIEKLRIN